MRKTASTVAVARALVGGLDDIHWGAKLKAATGVHSGTLYPILQRMERDGWLVGQEERGKVVARPRRRYFQVTSVGMERLQGIADADVPDLPPPTKPEPNSIPLSPEDMHLLIQLAFQWDVSPQEAMRRAFRQALAEESEDA